MANFDNFTPGQVTKMIYLGHTGAGKTGSLVSLAAAGYRVRILDLDKGVEILGGYIKDPKSSYCQASPGLWTAEQVKDISKRISFIQLNESISIKSGRLIKKGDLWQKVGEVLNNWEDGEDKPGSILNWGPKDILVIDSFSRLSDAALSFQLSMNGRLATGPQQNDWWPAQNLLELFLQMMFSSEVKCNVIVICHIGFIETETGPTRGFPQTIGKALAPKIGQYFNSALLAQASGSGAAAKRVILTSTAGMIELKNTAPLRVKAEYPIATGLAEYFRDVRSGYGESK